MRQKRVAVIAYCARNLGDDLFTTLIADRYPKTQFCFFAPDLDSLSAVADRPNVSIVNDSSFRKARFDVLVVLGGSMFQEQPAWYRRWARYLLRFGWARLRRCPIVIIGISFGPVQTRLFLAAHRTLFRMASWISVRDSASREMLDGLRHLHQFPDLAFAHPLVLPRTRVTHEPYVGMSVMDFGPGLSHPNYLSQCAALIESITAAAPVRLFAFQEYGGIDDGAAILKMIDLLSSYSKGRVTVVHYDGSNMGAFLDAFGGSSVVVATRFHSTVLAAAMAIPCVSISYHPKVRDTIETLHLPVMELLPEQLVEAGTAVREAVLESMTLGRTKTELEHRAAAINHFTYLDSLLSLATP